MTIILDSIEKWLKQARNKLTVSIEKSMFFPEPLYLGLLCVFPIGKHRYINYAFQSVC